MKVAVTGLRGFPDVQGGIETHCEKLYPRLAKRGCCVTVFTRRPYMHADATVYRGVSLHSLPSPTNKFLETVSHTFRSVIAARRMGPDIQHIHGIGPSLFAPLARVLGMRVVVTTHGPDYERAKWRGAAKIFLRFCERLGMKYAHEVIAIAENIAADVKTRYNRATTVIPNGVEIPLPVETMDALLRFGLEKGRYILAVGRFVPEKGFHDLIEAFGKAGLEGWKLAIVGRADHEDAYSMRLREQVAGNANVVLTGFLKGTPLQELYSHAGLFALPSYYEGLPIVLLEALSYGLSCIVSDIPANKISGWPLAVSSRLSADGKELTANGQRLTTHGGRFFKTGDVDNLAAKISEFAAHPLSDEERAAQIEMIEREYNWDKIADETLAVYRRAVGR